MSEHHASVGPEHRLERLVFFSDAVFAIAITLLVIELHPPHLPIMAGVAPHLAALAELTPNFIGFVTSFFVIGAFWAGHHRAFALAGRWSDRLIAPNLMLLFAVAAMPFFTGYMSGNGTARLPVALYCLWLIATGLLNWRLQRLVTAPPIVDPGAPPALIREVRRRGLSVVLGASSALILAFLIPPPFTAMSLTALSTIGMWRRLLTRTPRGG